MQRLSWLFQDAVTWARLPLIPHQTPLQLVGFFMPSSGGLPGPVSMLAAHEGRLYHITPTGDAFCTQSYLKGEELQPDLPASPGQTTCVGYTAFALSPTEVLTGPHWQVRKTLRGRLKAGEFSPEVSTVLQAYLREQPRQLLAARQFARTHEMAKHC